MGLNPLFYLSVPAEKWLPGWWNMRDEIQQNNRCENCCLNLRPFWPLQGVCWASRRSWAFGGTDWDYLCPAGSPVWLCRHLCRPQASFPLPVAPPLPWSPVVSLLSPPHHNLSEQGKGTSALAKGHESKCRSEKTRAVSVVCTFTALHSFHKDTATLWEDPVMSPVAVLPDRHGAQ